MAKIVHNKMEMRILRAMLTSEEKTSIPQS
jgi:hypothetical protein